MKIFLLILMQFILDSKIRLSQDTISKFKQFRKSLVKVGSQQKLGLASKITNVIFRPAQEKCFKIVD